jgi:hypothetical protein
MADIVKINTVEVANIVKLNGVQPASFSKVLEQDFVTGYANTYSANFTGSPNNTDFGEFGSSSSTFFGSGAWTMSFWIKMEDFDDDNNNYYFTRGLTNQSEYNVIFSLGSINRFFVSSRVSGTIKSRIFTGFSLTDNTWHHIAITNSYVESSGGLNVYVDSVALSPLNSFYGRGIDQSFDSGSSDKWEMGAYANNKLSNHKYDEISIHHAELNQANITAMYNSGSPIDLSADSGNYNTSSSLAHWWKLNNDGTNSVDTSGNKDLAFSSGTTFSTDVPPS